MCYTTLNKLILYGISDKIRLLSQIKQTYQPGLLRMFTRQEVIKLTGLTRTQLSYLDGNDLIKPEKIGNPKKPHCLYSWYQLIGLRAYARLREKCSLQSLREVIDYLNPETIEQFLADKRLIVMDNQFIWINDNPDEIVGILLNGKNQGQLIASFTFADLIDDIKQNGGDTILNLENRLQKVA